MTLFAPSFFIFYMTIWPQPTSDGEFWVGATRTTNNKAEMQALIEALYLLNSGIEDKSIPDDEKVMVTVDSLYVKGLIEQQFTARENKAVVMLLCHLWKVVKNQESINIRWVRGHTGDAGNTVADALADLGTRQDGKHRWWKRMQPMSDWEEASFQTKLKKLEEEKYRMRRLSGFNGTVK